MFKPLAVLTVGLSLLPALACADTHARPALADLPPGSRVIPRPNLPLPQKHHTGNAAADTRAFVVAVQRRNMALVRYYEAVALSMHRGDEAVVTNVGELAIVPHPQAHTPR